MELTRLRVYASWLTAFHHFRCLLVPVQGDATNMSSGNIEKKQEEDL